jgi:hypothetical protein
MISSKEKHGIFSKILSLFTKNWGLKLLSLFFAVLIYYSLKK